MCSTNWTESRHWISYKSYLGDRASELPASGLLFPLAIRSNAGDGKHVVRTLLAVDEKNNSMTFAGDIQQGHFAQLMKANLDRLIDGASKAAVMANENSDPSAARRSPWRSAASAGG